MKLLVYNDRAHISWKDELNYRHEDFYKNFEKLKKALDVFRKGQSKAGGSGGEESKK